MDYFEKHLFSPPQIKESSSVNLGMIITIPCFNETHLLRTLDSLNDCELPEQDTEVIVNVNSSEVASEFILDQNKKTMNEFQDWESQTKSDKIKFHLINSPALPKKHAGVGLARKIAMDEAAWRFSKVNNPKGVIVCLDADCTVEKNYLRELEKHFFAHPKTSGCSVYFEHPVEGTEYDKEIYSSIINYELFLRYYTLGLKYTGFPYPFDTIGSCMAIRSHVYLKQGGMNRRQAGEDFYFLHKIFPLENFTEITSTKVIPSPRLSDRVPFGTGADITKQLFFAKNPYTVYNPKSFFDLKKLFEVVPLLYLTADKSGNTAKIPQSIAAFLKQEQFEKKFAELLRHTASLKTFMKRFFNWFDGFKVLKYMHFARDHYYPQLPVSEAIQTILSKMGTPSDSSNEKELLIASRMFIKNAYKSDSKINNNKIS